MSNTVKIAKHNLSNFSRCFIIAEIGINHNGSIDTAKNLIKLAKSAGCDAVKFQKRTVDKVYTPEELSMPRESVFGSTNGDLKYGLEFGYNEYKQIDEYCKSLDITWFASCWDLESIDFIEKFDVPCHKVPSALITDLELLEKLKSTNKPILLATGMSTMEQIDKAVEFLGEDNLVIMHATSTYPSDNNELNLNVIPEFMKKYSAPIGYSGHEKGIFPSAMAASMGACTVERHITLDRTAWGSDHPASLEPEGLRKLVRDIRSISSIKGDGVKVVYDSELPILAKLRKVGN